MFTAVRKCPAAAGGQPPCGGEGAVMRFSDILENIRILSTNILFFDYCIGKPVSDSCKVSRGDVYICKRGNDHDGHDFIPEAAENGAGTIVAERVTPYMCRHRDLRYITVHDTAIAEVMMLDSYYDHPTKNIKLVGITGTNGKTSTAFMLREIIAGSGHKCGMIGTLKSLLDDEVIDDNPANMTTPAPSRLFETLSVMRSKKAEYTVLEASSHALDQKRLDALNFELGVFTNLTEDHLDYHRTFDNYKIAKSHLFDLCKLGLVNADVPFGRTLAASNRCRMKTYSLRDRSADFCAEALEYSENGVKYNIDGIKINCKMPGVIGAYNSLAAAASAILLGIPKPCIAEALENMPQIPGRLEKLDLPVNYSVYIDYAHTPDALEKALSILRPLTSGRLIAVFGCGGDREHEKRPIMGRLACELADFCIITSDNPRSEAPCDIIKEIETGISDSTKRTATCKTIPSRSDAIIFALENAKAGDTVLLAGKGHEDYEIIGKNKRHFSEKEIINDYFQGKNRK